MACENCKEPSQEKLAYCNARVKNPPADRCATMRCLACGQFYAEYISSSISYALAYKPVSIRGVLCKDRAIKSCPLMEKTAA
jgi:hypothetical protein